MKKLLTLAAFVLLSLSVIFTGCSKGENAGSNEKKEFKYYTAEETKKAIEEKKDIILLDIQVEDEFKAHHIKGVVPTYAYPVKSDDDKAKLEKVLPDLEKSKSPIVIVCPGGAGGAEKTFTYLSEKGISKDRLYILEKGQKGWPYDELLEK